MSVEPPSLVSLKSNPRLPSLPTVAIEILELTRDDNVNMDAIANVIQNDQAIAAKVLRTINSSYYGLATPCSNVSRAIALLGVNAVKTVVLGFSLIECANGGGGEDVSFDFISYWRRTLYSAAAARDLAKSFTNIDCDDAFLAALMQDIGMVAIYRVWGDRYLLVTDPSEVDHLNLPYSEMMAMEFTHASVGADLAAKWNLPEQIVTAIRFHHDSDNAPDDMRPLASVVELAGLAAASIINGCQTDLLDRFKEAGHTLFGLTIDQAEDFLKRLVDLAQDLTGHFQLCTGDRPDVPAILAQAEEQSLEHHMQLHSKLQSLTQDVEQSREMTLKDELTGVGSRRAFDLFMKDLFEIPFNERTSTALLLVVPREYRLVAETHGRQAAGEMLAFVANQLNDAITDSASVYRYDGDLFSVVLPDHDEEQAVACASLACESLNEHVFVASDEIGACESYPANIIIGLVTLDGALKSELTTPEKFVAAADAALRAAIRAETEDVRTYTGRRPIDEAA